MLPLYREPHFTFRFTEDRLIPRIHLEDVAAETPVTIYWIDPDTRVRLDLLTRAKVGEGGWVELPEPLLVRAGQAFIVVPED